MAEKQEQKKLSSTDMLEKIVEMAKKDPKFFHDLVFNSEETISKLDFLDRRGKASLIALSPNEVIAGLIGVGGWLSTKDIVNECGTTCGNKSCSDTCGDRSCFGTCQSSCTDTCASSCDNTTSIIKDIVFESFGPRAYGYNRFFTPRRRF